MFTLNAKNLLTSTAALAVALGTVAIAPQSAKAGSFGNSGDNGNKELCPLADTTDCSLQNLLDSITVAGPGIDAVKDQSSAQWWTTTSASGSIQNILFEAAGFQDKNNFGIYKKGSPDKKVQIFGGLAAPGNDSDGPTQSWLTFLNNGKVKLNGTVVATDFGDEFGFYLETPEDNIFYTEDALNENGYEQSVVYQGNEKTYLQVPGGADGKFVDSDWIIAFEDLVLNKSDSDYNDFVIVASDLESTPEPATMAGLGLVGAAMLGLRRNNKKNS